MRALAILVMACSAPPPATVMPRGAARFGAPAVLGAKTVVRPGGLAALAVTPDGKRAVSADRAGPGVIVWDTATWEPIAQLGDRKSHTVAISPDGAFIVSGDDDGNVRDWSVADKHLCRALPLADPIATWTDGARVIAVAKGGEIKVWESPTGRCDGLAATRGRVGTGAITIAAITRAGDRFVLSGSEGTEFIADLAKPRGDAAISASALAYSLDGTQLAIGATEGRVSLWNTATGARDADNNESAGWPIRAIALGTPGHMLIALSTQGQYLVARPSGTTVSAMEGPYDQLVAFDHGALGATHDGAIRELDLEAGKARATDAHTGMVQHVGFAGAAIVSDGAWPTEATARRWEPGQPSRALTPHGHVVAISPRGTLAAINDAPDNVALRIIDLAGHQPELVLDVDDPEHVAFSADDRFAVTSIVGTVRRIELATKHVVTWSTGTDALQALAISRDGSLVATGGDRIDLWDATTGAHRRTLAPDSLNVSVLAFTPTSLVTASESGGIERFDLATNTSTTLYAGERGKPQGSSDAAYAGDVSDDGTLLVTGHGSGIVRLWSLADGKQLAQAQHDHAVIDALDLAPDGAHIVTGDRNGQLVVWPIVR